MKNSELKLKSSAELSELLRQIRAKLSQLRFDLADKKLQDVSQLQKARRDVARILTHLKTGVEKAV